MGYLNRPPFATIGVVFALNTALLPAGCCSRIATPKFPEIHQLSGQVDRGVAHTSLHPRFQHAG